MSLKLPGYSLSPAGFYMDSKGRGPFFVNQSKQLASPIFPTLVSSSKTVAFKSHSTGGKFTANSSGPFHG